MHISLLACKFTPRFGKSLTVLFPAINTFAKYGVEYFCRNFAINLMITGWRCSRFCACRSFPFEFCIPFLACVEYGTKSVGLWTVPGKPPFAYISPPLNLAMVVCPVVYIILIVPLPWHCDLIQEFISSYIIN